MLVFGGTLTSKKATSLHRRPRSNDDDLVIPDSEDERISNADSYVETEVDSSPEEDTSEATQSRPSRLHRAVAIEACFFL